MGGVVVARLPCDHGVPGACRGVPCACLSDLSANRAIILNLKADPLFIFTPKPFYFQGRQTGEIIGLFMEFCTFYPTYFCNLIFDNRQFKNAFAQLFMLKVSIV